jgi:hypothetical protein
MSLYEKDLDDLLVTQLMNKELNAENLKLRSLFLKLAIELEAINEWPSRNRVKNVLSIADRMKAIAASKSSKIESESDA